MKTALIGYGIAVVLGFFLLMAREDIGKLKEQCNTEKAQAVAAAERLTREVERNALQKRIAELVERAEREGRAKEAAEEARRRAESTLTTATAEIDRLIREATDENAPIEKRCLVTRVPADAISGLRTN